MSNPEGLYLDSPKNLLRIGSRLGSGACGVVYDVVISGSRSAPPKDEPSRLAVKMVPYVAPTAALSNKKKKKTEAQRNSDLLYHEYMLYRNAFNSLRGTVIPLVPLSTPGFGDIPGYRYLLMEKMEHPLFAILPSDMASSFGEIATTLISHVEQVHSLNFLVVDIKPENWMVTYNPPKKSNPLHSRIRIIDIGLFDKFIDAMTQKHRPDLFPDGPVVGTPVYASLNVLQGHTISRRDDLEALGYLIVEMMLLILHNASSSSANGKRASVPAHGLLPWSDGKSDNEILQKKMDIIDQFLSSNKTTKKSGPSASSSSLLNDLSQHNNESAAQAIKGYMALTRQLAFGDRPDYEALKRIVSKISIQLPQKMASASLKSPTPLRRKENLDSNMSGAKNAASSSTEITSSEPLEKSASSSRQLRKRIVKTTIVEEEMYYCDEDGIVEEDTHTTRRKQAKTFKSDKEDEETSFKSCQAGEEMMDWERVDTEPSNIVIGSHTNDVKESPSLQLIVVGGPHSGESFSVSATSVLGRQNSKSAQGHDFNLKKDSQIGASHAKVTLSTSKQGIHSLRVTDLKTPSGTFVNNHQIPSGKYRQAFIGDKIQVGSTVLEVKRF